MPELVGPGKVDPIVAAQWGKRHPRLTDAVHVTAGDEKCSAAWIVHVGPDDGIDMMMAYGPGDIRFGSAPRSDVPQIQMASPNRILTWHYPALCPWGR